MKVRAVLTLTGIVSSILGALVVYLMLSVPNDLRADALLKNAREDMTAGRTDKARTVLMNVVQQYPRTDAAAAATAALLSLEQKERSDLARSVEQLRTQTKQQSQVITGLQKSIADLANAPPKVVTVQAPAPKPAAKKVTPKKKKTTPKKKTRRRR
jgi:TolA-binding protein